MNRKEKWVKHLIGLVLTARGEKKMDLGWCPIVLSLCWPSAEGGNGVRQLSIYRGEQQRRLSGKQLRWQSVRPQDFHQRLLRRGTAQDGVVGCGLVKPQRIHFNVWGNFKTSIYSQSRLCALQVTNPFSHTYPQNHQITVCGTNRLMRHWVTRLPSIAQTLCFIIENSPRQRISCTQAPPAWMTAIQVEDGELCWRAADIIWLMRLRRQEVRTTSARDINA